MTQIITPASLKDQSLIDVNVQDFYCDAAIKTAQEIFLVQIIGESLYNKIISLIVANSLTGKYKDLVDYYIINYLLYEATAEIQIPLAYKNRNMGIVRTTDPEVEIVELKEIQYIVDYYKNRADFYSVKIKNFILDNLSSFPEYCAESTNEIKPGKSWTCPINL